MAKRTNRIGNSRLLLRPYAKWRRRAKCLFVILTLFVFAAIAQSEEAQPALKSGPAIGSEISSFYVRAVTGPLAGKSVCYVCRNGDRPVVMVLIRELGPDVARLLKRLDVTVNEHRADGLRCFAVLLSDSSQKDAARLQTLAFDEKLDLPLTLAGESMTGSLLSNVSAEAAVTVVLYHDLKVTERFCFRSNECDEAACDRILKAARALAKSAAE